jgi:hypothetical protein
MRSAQSIFRKSGSGFSSEMRQCKNAKAVSFSDLCETA